MAASPSPGRLTRALAKRPWPVAAHLWQSAKRRTAQVIGGGASAEIDERIAILQAKQAQQAAGRVDPFGLDLEWARAGLRVIEVLHRHYFRTDVYGVEHVPEGPILLVGNHSGQVPIDGAMVGASLFFDAPSPRIIRSMVEKWTQTLPFISVLFSRVGQVVGVPENARELLKRGETLMVFPEGSRGISKPFAQRYKLGKFGLGFMRLALELNVPIVPVAVVGAEEQYINFGNFELLANALGMPVFPLIPQFFIPGLQMPLPTKYRIYFGKPLQFEGDFDDDDAVIEEKVWQVKQTIQSMVNDGLEQRKSVFF